MAQVCARNSQGFSRCGAGTSTIRRIQELLLGMLVASFRFVGPVLTLVVDYQICFTEEIVATLFGFESRIALEET